MNDFQRSFVRWLYVLAAIWVVYLFQLQWLFVLPVIAAVAAWNAVQAWPPERMLSAAVTAVVIGLVGLLAHHRRTRGFTAQTHMIKRRE